MNHRHDGAWLVIGVFDGVHVAHRSMIDHARAHAGGYPVQAVTFHPHPRAAVTGVHPGLLCPLEYRIELLAACTDLPPVVLAFDDRLRLMSPDDFVRDELVDRLGARGVTVGENFRFGHRAAGSASLLHDLCDAHSVQVAIAPTCTYGGEPVSSTRIRDLLREGDVAAATSLLGRPFDLSGIVVRGAQRGRQLGFPTANLRLPADLLVPCDGVYAGIAHLGPDLPSRRAAISIGTNPQFTSRQPNAPRSVEAYLLDFDGDLYGQMVRLDLLDRVRTQQQFASVAALVEQIQADVDDVRERIALPGT